MNEDYQLIKDKNGILKLKNDKEEVAILLRDKGFYFGYRYIDDILRFNPSMILSNLSKVELSDKDIDDSISKFIGLESLEKKYKSSRDGIKEILNKLNSIDLIDQLGDVTEEDFKKNFDIKDKLFSDRTYSIHDRLNDEINEFYSYKKKINSAKTLEQFRVEWVKIGTLFLITGSNDDCYCGAGIQCDYYSEDIEELKDIEYIEA